MPSYSSLFACARRILALYSEECCESDAMGLLCEASGRSRTSVIMDFRRQASFDEAARYASFIRRRASGEPFAYITGHREFMSLDFEVSAKCLIPRPETELLCEHILSLPSENRELMLDLCCGSGCIGISVAVYDRNCEIYASDISAGALSVAENNAKKHGVDGRMRFFLGDMFSNIPEGVRFGAIASNPPYIGIGERISRDVADFEPHEALFSGADGTDASRKIIDSAPRYLKEGGVLAIEINSARAEEIRRMFENAGFSDISVIKDYAGLDRIVSGIKK